MTIRMFSIGLLNHNNVTSSRVRLGVDISRAVEHKRGKAWRGSAWLGMAGFGAAGLGGVSQGNARQGDGSLIKDRPNAKTPSRREPGGG
jgi:hypothetical protein